MKQTLHDHEHRHWRHHPHASGHTIDVRHSHGHRHTGLVAGTRTEHAPYHREHFHTAEEEADLRRQQLR